MTFGAAGNSATSGANGAVGTDDGGQGQSDEGVGYGRGRGRGRGKDGAGEYEMV